MPCVTNFDFQNALLWMPTCKKVFRSCHNLAILTSKSLSRQRGASFGNISHPPFFGIWLCVPAKPQNYGNTRHFAQFLPSKATSSHTSALYHICVITSRCWQILGGNSQYSRKLHPKVPLAIHPTKNRFKTVIIIWKGREKSNIFACFGYNYNTLSTWYTIPKHHLKWWGKQNVLTIQTQLYSGRFGMGAAKLPRV